MSEEKSITLYPSNWLYNAGVVGFLNCLDREDYLNAYNQNNQKYSIDNDGKVSIKSDVFEKIKVEENYFESGKVINLKGKNSYYPNFIDVQGNQKHVFEAFVKAFYYSSNIKKYLCDFCTEGIGIDISKINNNINKDQKERFFSKISELNMAHNKLLGPSERFPNSYWNLQSGFKICHLCTFMLIHHHLALTRLSDGSDIFINAPSFKLMYELNKLVKELFGKNEADQIQKREILAMSIIEYTRRLQTTLGQWNAMNIEIVIKKGDLIDFFSLPYETVNLISDRAIASLLSDLGEFSILNMVLNGSFTELIDLAHNLIKISIKSDINKANQKLIDAYLYRYLNKSNLNLTANRILRLYATIIERRRSYA